MPSADLFRELRGLMVTVTVFSLLLVPFMVSYFLAFKKFDLKPVRSFNRRQLLFLFPPAALGLGGCLGGFLPGTVLNQRLFSHKQRIDKPAQTYYYFFSLSAMPNAACEVEGCSSTGMEEK